MINLVKCFKNQYHRACIFEKLKHWKWDIMTLFLYFYFSSITKDPALPCLILAIAKFYFHVICLTWLKIYKNMALNEKATAQIFLDAHKKYQANIASSQF